MSISKADIAVVFFILAALSFGLALFDVTLGKLSLPTAGLLFTAIGLAFHAWRA